MSTVAFSNVGRPHILLVEDDADLAEELRDFLQLNGLDVRMCSNAADALKAVEVDPALRVVATDIGLGAVSGLELLRKLGQSSRRDAIQTIVLSGNTSVDNLLSALRLGAVDFLSKPLAGPELLGAVHRALERGALKQSKRQQPITSSKLLMDVRKKRDALFGADLFEDPAWNMLLDLHESTTRGIPVAVSDLCTGAGTSATTALRRLTTLVNLGLVERVPDPSDRRRVYVRQTRLGAEKMQAFAQWFNGQIYDRNG